MQGCGFGIPDAESRIPKPNLNHSLSNTEGEQQKQVESKEGAMKALKPEPQRGLGLRVLGLAVF